jgi:methyl-accepting chemotaxis protein
MHAASAGEAGKGFAVVADEVQRLAENARDATNQIATLVHNIQVETSDTVATMNNVISQVVEGSRMAEQAGEQMRKTKDTTENLVSSVREIAQSSSQQAQLSSELRVRAELIHENATKTTEQLNQQSLITTRLVEYARSLLKAVQVFQLPGYAPDKSARALPEATVLATDFEKRKVS